MAGKETHPERIENAPLATRVPATFAAYGKKSIEAFANTQTEVLDKLQATTRQWFDRMETEAKLVNEFGSKLTEARSIPDAMTSWQEWAAQLAEMMAEDRNHLVADCQMFAEMGTRLLAKGWSQNGSGKST